MHLATALFPLRASRLCDFATLRETLLLFRGLLEGRSVGEAQHKMKSAPTIRWRRIRPEMALTLSRGAACALALASLLAPTVWAAQAKPLAVLEGQLLTTRGDCPMVKINGREMALTADTAHLLHTMQDKRLDGREVRLEGIPRPDGSFEVKWFYTLHNGKLFRVRYFCATCNIVALEPGNCVCCQQPTELQEIPVEKSEN
jgi:hypothetical protein